MADCARHGQKEPGPFQMSTVIEKGKRQTITVGYGATVSRLLALPEPPPGRLT